MTMPAAAASSGWTVTGQQETTKPDTAGNFTQGVTVYFTTGAGVQSSVFVPNLQYTQDNVRAAIAARAAQVDAVQALSEPPAAQ